MTGPRAAIGGQGLAKSYGPVRANRGITLAVAPGTIHAVVGENGAGKSTLMRLLQGVERPDEGTVVIDDRPVAFSGPADALARGVGMVHQEFMLAPSLSLLENLVLGDERARGPLGRIGWAAAEAEGRALAASLGVAVDWRRRAGAAPVHVQQFAEIIRLLRRGTRVLILDEPTAVLAPPQVQQLFATLGAFRAGGGTVLFISHKVPEVMALADRVTVIREGEVAFEAAVADTDAAVVAGHILRGAAAAAAPPRASFLGPAVLSVRALRAPSVDRSQPLDDVGFDLRAGEVLGVAGVAGNGQDELVEALMGLRPAGGRIDLDGRDMAPLATSARRAAGMAYVSADRRHEGLALDADLVENAVAGSHRDRTLRRGPLLSPATMAAEARTRLARVGVRFGRTGDAARTLSGGNQQRLVLARELARRPRVLIASQPTRGVDLAGIAAIHDHLRAFRDGGGAVLLVSEELDELQGLADRLLVLARGRVAGEAAADAPRDLLGRLMLMEGAAV